MFISIWSCSGLCSTISGLVACLCLEVSGLVLACVQQYCWTAGLVLACVQ